MFKIAKLKSCEQFSQLWSSQLHQSISDPQQQQIQYEEVRIAGSRGSQV